MRGQTAKRAEDGQVDRHAGRSSSATRHRPGARSRSRCASPSRRARAPSCSTVEGLKKGYGGPPVFSDVTFDVGRGERLLIMGLNGAGKTSLMRILAGQTDADAGTVDLGHRGVGRATTRRSTRASPRAARCSPTSPTPPACPTQQLRTLLGTFGLPGEIAFQDAGTLSGGEKTKLALAQLVAGRHNTLLLDEPTNNLDPPSRDAIGDALSHWPGAIVLVSHDAEFVARLSPDRVLLMPEGDLDYWSDDLLDLVALS